MSSITGDQAKHLGAVAAWLDSAPELKTEYGTFYVRAVTLSCDGEITGTFKAEDDIYLYTPQEDQP